jgi:hypothetical protein
VVSLEGWLTGASSAVLGWFAAIPSSVQWAATVLLVSIVAFPITAILTRALRKELRFARLDLNEGVRDELYRDFYLAWKQGDDLLPSPKVRSYGGALSLQYEEGHQSKTVRVARRAVKIDGLSVAQRAEWTILANAWINTVGAFAREASDSRIGMRTFLQGHHLEVIKEAVIIEPVIVWLSARGEWDNDEQLEGAAFGIALLKLAVRYNRMSPIQRGAVYLTSQETLCGPILDSGPNLLLTRALYSFADGFKPRFRLGRLTVLSAKRELDRITRAYRREKSRNRVE